MSKVAIISDVHLRDDHASAVTDAIESTVETLAARDPDHTFVLGDLIEDGGSKAVDEANVARVRECLSGIPAPITYLLGNHDVEHLTRADLASILDQDDFYGTVEVGDVPFLYLDTTNEETPGARGSVGRTQWNWLAETLSSLKPARPVVLCHHPLGAFDLADNVWFSDYPERAVATDRKEVLDLITRSHGIRGTISGHIHQTELSRFRGIDHVSINAFSKETPDIPVTGTYADVRIDDRVVVDVERDGEVRQSFTML
ncbi:MAG: metallophosphoesterase [Halobellus sp.]|uniref:metallophosphoesterase family protein n=1 Tax=Halobellus sp. TaxID=1979212 RepID=UPI0035D51D34